MSRASQLAIKHIVYPLHGLATGRPMLKRLAELEESQWWARKQLEELQWRKLRRLLIHAQENVPYYRRTFAEAGVDTRRLESPADMRLLPMLSKDDIRNNLQDLVAIGTPPASLKLYSTSGSTGQNMKFYMDNDSRGSAVAAVMRNHRWMGADIGELEVTIWGSPFELSAARKLSGRLNYALQGVKFLSAYELKPDSLAEFAKKIRKWKPSIISGYTTALDVFAKYMIDNGIGDIHPKGVISSAEMLFPHQRERIEKAFGCKAFNRYGCREFITLAHECECGGFHVNMERVLIETVPDAGCPEGCHPGELLITDLDNYGSPMIRYRIGDMAVIDDTESCLCGRGLSMLQEIQGRTFDIIRTPSGRMLPGLFWTILSKSVPGVDQLQIVQKSLTRIVVNLKVDETFPSDAIPRLSRRIVEFCGQDIEIEINLVERIEPTASGKLRFVISELEK